MINVEKYKVQLGVPDTDFIFNTLEEAQKFANEEGSASGIKTTIIKFEVVEGEEHQKDVNRLEQEIQRYHSFFKTLNEFLAETKDI